MTEIPQGAYFDWSDAAKRAADNVMLHVHAIGEQAVGRWVAIALADGSSDGVLYDTKRDAVRHQARDELACYVCIPPDRTVTARQMELFLKLNRGLYDAGCRMADPDDPHGGRDPIPRYDQVARPGRLVIPRQSRRFT